MHGFVTLSDATSYNKDRYIDCNILVRHDDTLSQNEYQTVAMVPYCIVHEHVDSVMRLQRAEHEPLFSTSPEVGITANRQKHIWLRFRSVF